MHPLDQELPIETLEKVHQDLQKIELELAQRFQIPWDQNRSTFIRNLARRLHELNINEDPQVMYWQSAYAALQDWDQDWLLLLSRIEAANLNDQSLWGPPITDINAFVNSLFNEPDKP
jgi:hypothetical protein